MTKVILAANTDWYLYNYRLPLARFLRDQGFEIVLLSPPGKYEPAFEADGFRWISWQIGRQTLAPWQELPSILRLAQIYRRERPDLVHHHTIKPVIYGSLAARALSMENVINSITGRGYVFLGKNPRARLLKPLARRMYRLAFDHDNYAAIFENETDRGYFIDQRFLPAGRAWLVPGVGVDPERFAPMPEPEGPVTVLFSGRMLWDKGVGVLVEAARLLRRKGPVRFVLAGEPDPGNPTSIDAATLQKWAQEGVVEWWGWQPEMSSVYARCHIVALPTMYGEGVPTVLLEAAACGRPMIASDIPGCRDVVIDGYSGLIVPADDPTALAGALERLISDSELRGRMGDAARKLVMRKFAAGLIHSATLAVYRQVLGSPGLPVMESTQY